MCLLLFVSLCARLCGCLCLGGGSDSPRSPRRRAASSGNSFKPLLPPCELDWTYWSQWSHTAVPPKPDWCWNHIYIQWWAQKLYCDWWDAPICTSLLLHLSTILQLFLLLLHLFLLSLVALPFLFLSSLSFPPPVPAPLTSFHAFPIPHFILQIFSPLLLSFIISESSPFSSSTPTAYLSSPPLSSPSSFFSSFVMHLFMSAGFWKPSNDWIYSWFPSLSLAGPAPYTDTNTQKRNNNNTTTST